MHLEQVTAIAAESASELCRSGGFKLIFPVGNSSHKFLRFFDDPRPLERMLAAANTNSPTPEDLKSTKRRGENSVQERRKRPGVSGEWAQGDNIDRPLSNPCSGKTKTTKTLAAYPCAPSSAYSISVGTLIAPSP